MAGRKLFTNLSPYPIHVTLVVRQSADPRHTAGTKEFMLSPQESQWQEYGNDIDIYLNGMSLAAVVDGKETAQQMIAIVRGSVLDNQLNMRNGVDFAFASNAFSVMTRQVS